MDAYKVVISANRYRAENDKPSGVVLLFEGKVYGWKNSLRNANHEKPGVIAVDSDGHMFQAQGGDDTNGAKLWVAI